MSSLPIVKLFKNNYQCNGSCLRIAAEKITMDQLNEAWFCELISDMLETLYANATGVGLAANQVAILKQVCVVDIKRDGTNPIILVNPSYSSVDGETENSKEGCLSFPEITAEVMRFKKVAISYTNIKGEQCDEEVEGFKAIVIQHEIDHLNGIVHIDLVIDNDRIEFVDDRAIVLAKKAMNKLNKVEM